MTDPKSNWSLSQAAAAVPPRQPPAPISMMPPPSASVTTTANASLVQKLELLEARFTAPILPDKQLSSPPLHQPPQQQHYGEEDVVVPRTTINSTPRAGADDRSLLIDESSAATHITTASAVTSRHLHEDVGSYHHHQHSHQHTHSFVFDPPSRSALAAALSRTSSPASASFPPPTTEQVQRAAEMQIARIAAAAGGGGGESAVGSGVTRVQETPPPPNLASTAADAYPADVIVDQSQLGKGDVGSPAKSKKRKQSAPTRRTLATVSDATSKIVGSASGAADSNHVPKVDPSLTSSAATAAAPLAARKRGRREPLRDRRASPPLADGRNSRSSPPGRANPRAAGGTSASPSRSAKVVANPSTTTVGLATAAGIGGAGSATSSTATIYDYFRIKSRANQNRSRLTDIRHDAEAGERADGSSYSDDGDDTNSQNLRNRPTMSAGRAGDAPANAKSRESSTASSVSSSPSRQIIQELQAQLAKVQEELQDKDGQLRAIRNSRSVLHAALQSTLSTREEELRTVEQTLEETRRKYRASLERFVRDQSAQEAKSVRDQLAVDGARLGRIVTTRAGLRTVEAWEDGPALKLLRQRKKELAAQAAVTKERQAQASKLLSNSTLAPSEARTAGQPLGRQSSTSPSNHNIPVAAESAAGMKPIDLANALASAELHVANLQRNQSDLEKQERELQLEKTTHIRALKRVASEDASRFRNRPKLHDRYLLRSLLGKGGFSEVWKAYDLTELREVAVKIHQLDPRWSDAKKESFTKHVSREYEIHRGVRHPRIVSLYDVFEIDINSFATVLECCHGTDLDTLIKERRTLPESEARAILLQILVGMQYLSQPSADGSRPGIIHYDLKPGNILFDEFGDAKITDFGLSKIVEADSAESMELTSQGAGTYWYLPPECFVTDAKVRISNKVDVWAIGVIFYQMLFGRRPFGDGMSQDKLLSDKTMLNARNVVFPEAVSVSAGGQDFIRACLQYDQEDRPFVAQLCEHPYVISKSV